MFNRRMQLTDLGCALLVGFLAWTSAWLGLVVRNISGFEEREHAPWRHGAPYWTAAYAGDGPVVYAVTAAGIVVLMVGTALRSRLRRTGYGLVMAGTAAYLAVGGPYGPVLLAPALAVMALVTQPLADGMHYVMPPSRRWWLLLAVPVVLTAGFWTAPRLGLTSFALYAAVVFGSAFILLPSTFLAMRRSRQLAVAAERAAELRSVADNERLRIAQEVHDLVGHSLSVIHLQAGVALHVLARQPDKVEESLIAIRTSSKAALAELRTTLDMLRDPDAAEPAEPLPGLARLEGLLGAVRAAGREVRVEIAADALDGLPAALDHGAYRIVQEAVTNAVRHAPDAAIDVWVERTADRLILEVRDHGAVVRVDSFVEGNGLSGIRERTRVLGGQLSIAERAGGGVRVRVELPADPPGPEPTQVPAATDAGDAHHGGSVEKAEPAELATTATSGVALETNDPATQSSMVIGASASAGAGDGSGR